MTRRPGTAAVLAAAVLLGSPGAFAGGQRARPDLAFQLQAEQRLLAAYPARSYLAAVACSDQGVDAARMAARAKVSEAVRVELSAALRSIEQEWTRDGSTQSSREILQEFRQTTRFTDGELIRHDPTRDVAAASDVVCAAAHMDRREADQRFAQRWDDAHRRLREAAVRCDDAFARRDAQAHAMAWTEAQAAFRDATSAYRDRRAVGGGDDRDVTRAIDLHARLRADAAAARSALRFHVRVDSQEPSQAPAILQMVVATLQELGIQAGGGDADNATHKIVVTASQTCQSDPMGPWCRVRLTLSGGPARVSDRPMSLDFSPADASRHFRSRAVALADAYRAAVTAPELRQALRDSLARVAPL